MNFFSIFALVTVVFLWGLLHSLTASLQFKAFLRRTLGNGVDRYYRLIYNLFSILSFLFVLILALIIPDKTIYVVSFPWAAIMITGEFAALAVLLLAFRQTDILDFLGIRQIIGPKSTKPHKLVTKGFYAYVRHPLYSAGLAIIWLLPFMTARVLVINLALTVYVVVGAYIEERKLRHRFGQEYIDYSAETPMFIPFLKKIRNRISM
jgi:methanethiol S-methyltransferase